MAQIFQGVERTEYLAVGLVLLMDEGIASLDACDERTWDEFIHIERYVSRIAHIVEFADVHRLILATLGCRINPVDDVLAFRVESAQHSLNAACAVACTNLEGRVAFWAEVGIALLCRVGSIEVGECGHTQRLVPRCVELPVVARTIRDVYARIETKTVVESRIAVGKHASRQGEPTENHVMLKEDARVGAVATMVVVAVGTMYGSPLALVEQRSVCSTEDVLLAQVDANGCLTQ